MMGQNEHHCCRSKLGIFSFAVASGITWALGVFFLGIIAMKYELGGPVVTLLGSMYKGFEPTVVGAAWGGLWALLDGFIGGAVLAFLYNLCIRCCRSCCTMCCKKKDQP